jgi:cysteine-rich repeat protein
MKAIALGYGGILIIFLVTTITVMYIIGASEPVNRTIVTVEGKLMSFENNVNNFIKSYDQSITFISQRAAYDLGKTGGLRSESYWTETYPTMDLLESELEETIKQRMPYQKTEDKLEVAFGGKEINVLNYDSATCNDQIHGSICFYINGEQSMSLYDRSVDSTVMLEPYEFKPQISSNYFKLLTAGRAAMEEFSSYLGNPGGLVDQLYSAGLAGDSRFSDLDFDWLVASDQKTVEITIVERCASGMHCVSPLKSGEAGELNDDYDYNKLIFKYQKDQTGSQTSPAFGFSLGLSPSTGSSTVICSSSPVCGDGNKDGSEGCDDGDTTGGDGCSVTCTVESGWQCTGSPSVCTPICGNGIVTSPEACDDSNMNSGDGCSSSCQVESGCTCSGQPSTCTCQSQTPTPSYVQWRLTIDNPDKGKMHITTTQSGIDQDVTMLTTFSLRVGEQVTIKAIANSNSYRACVYPDGYSNNQACAPKTSMKTYTSPLLTVSQNSGGSIVHANFHSTCASEDPSNPNGPSYCADTLTPPVHCIDQFEVCHAFTTDCNCCCY